MGKELIIKKVKRMIIENLFKLKAGSFSPLILSLIDFPPDQNI